MKRRELATTITTNFDTSGLPGVVRLEEFGTTAAAQLSTAEQRGRLQNAIGRFQSIAIRLVLPDALGAQPPAVDCSNEMIARDAAFAIWVELEIEATIAAGLCPESILTCAAYWAIFEQLTAADLALAMAIQVYVTCTHRLTNVYGGGSTNGEGKWCITTIYLETWDGGRTWAEIDRTTTCYGEWEE